MNKHTYPEMKYLACAQHKTHYIGSCQQCINTSEQANHQAAEERAAIIHYIKTQGDLSNIPDNDKCKHGAYSWNGCETCYQENLVKNLIKGEHHQ